MKKKSFKKIICIATMLLMLTSTAGAAFAQELIPGGDTVGIQMETDGIMIVGLTQVETADGGASPASDAGLMPGDMIVRFGDRQVTGAADLAEELAGLDGSAVTVTVRRGERLIQYTLQPAFGAGDTWQLGLLLRDGVAGIGTITYLDPDSGCYGALGHGVCDAETGLLIPIGEGQVLHAAIDKVIPGQVGTPGELRGTFDAEGAIGSIERNTESGIFGQMNEAVSGQTLETAKSSEICTGPATIRSTISGTEAQEYDVEITRVYRNGNGETRMMLAVTDPELLSATGGIVQGMSGSPIIQNGKIVGAVTHVLVNDPTKGYGISIEDMLSAAA